MQDLAVRNAIEAEWQRQNEHIELIASENFVSSDILEAVGSILTNKYAEGYPSKRYYGGCENIDVIENLACERMKELFQAEYANVQPHSGSQANMAVYLSVLEPHDKVLGMSLADGGHLTHGHPMNFSGILYDFYGYGVSKDSETIDYNEVRKMAKELKPKLIVAGASAYPRQIDFKKLREIADEVEAYLMVDMAHIAGLVATGLHPSPIPYADFVTTTTHKTLRGPRGGAILCKAKYGALIDKKVFPGMQGGPLEHVIAGKAICFKEAMQPEFKTYMQAVVDNAKVLAEELSNYGLRIISGGTDNHMLLVDTMGSFNISGKEAEKLLHSVNITCNKNAIPFDTQKPFVTSGIRLGSAAMTTRGFSTKEFMLVAKFIYEALTFKDDENKLAEIRAEVLKLTALFPIYNK